VTRGQLPQRAGSLGLNGGGAAAAVPPQITTMPNILVRSLHELGVLVQMLTVSAYDAYDA